MWIPIAFFVWLPARAARALAGVSLSMLFVDQKKQHTAAAVECQERQSVARVQKSRRGEIWTTTTTAREWEVQINISFLIWSQKSRRYESRKRLTSRMRNCFFRCDFVWSTLLLPSSSHVREQLTQIMCASFRLQTDKKKVLITARPRSTFHTQITW